MLVGIPSQHPQHTERTQTFVCKSSMCAMDFVSLILYICACIRCLPVLIFYLYLIYNAFVKASAVQVIPLCSFCELQVLKSTTTYATTMCRQPSFLHVLSAEVAVATTTSLAMSAVHRCFVRSSGQMYLQYQHSVLPLLKPHKNELQLRTIYMPPNIY